MDEARLDELVRKLHHLPLDEPETKECLPFADMWAHASSGRSLGSAEGHVEQCPRCRRLLEIMRRELAAAEPEAAPSRPRRLVVRLAVPLAAAACLAIVVWLGWLKSSDARVMALIAPYCERVYVPESAAPTRGPGSAEPSDAATMTSELEESLAELRQRFAPLPILLANPLRDGLIASDEQGHLVLTANGRAGKRSEQLQKKVDQANEIRERLVEIIQAHVPALKDAPEEDIRRLLDRWIGDEGVFGD